MKQIQVTWYDGGSSCLRTATVPAETIAEAITCEIDRDSTYPKWYPWEVVEAKEVPQ